MGKVYCKAGMAAGIMGRGKYHVVAPWAVARGEAVTIGWVGLRVLTDELRIPGYLWEPSLATSYDASGLCSSCGISLV